MISWGWNILSWRREPPLRVMIYETVWNDTIILSEYHRILDLYVTIVREKGANEALAWYCTDYFRHMQVQHHRGLILCWTIQALASGEDDF